MPSEPLLTGRSSVEDTSKSAIGSASLTSNIVWGTVANLALPVTALVTGPVLARFLDPTGRGELASIVAPLTLALTVGLLGLPEAITYYVARERIDPALVVRAAVAPVAVLFVLVGGSLYFVAPALFAKEPQLVSLFRVTLLVLPIVYFAGLMRAAVLGVRTFRPVFWEQSATAVGRALLICALGVLGLLTVSSATWATLIPAVLAVSLLVSPFRAAVARGGQAAPRLGRKLVTYGVRSSGGGIAGFANQWLDQSLLLPLSGARQLGLYAVAVSLAGLTNALTGSVQRVLFSEAAVRDDWSFVSRVVRCTLLVVALGATLGSALAPFLIPALFGAAFRPAVGMSQVLLLAVIPASLNTVLGSGVAAHGRPGISSVAQFVALAVTIAGLLLLVPSLGAMGAAITSLCAYTTAFLILLAVIRRVWSIQPTAFLPRVEDVRLMKVRLSAFGRVISRS